MRNGIVQSVAYVNTTNRGRSVTEFRTTEELMGALAEIGRAWAEAATEERRRRLLRDQAILAARQEGMGIRAIARETGIDPSQVMRIVRRNVGA